MYRMYMVQERIDKAIHIVRRASLAPVERERESPDYDSGDQSELMRLCNTKRIAGVCIILLAAGAVFLLMPANIRYVPLKEMPYCLYIGASLGGLAFLLIALNLIWWKCALRPSHPKIRHLDIPRQRIVHTITNEYPFRYCTRERPLSEIRPWTPEGRERFASDSESIKPAEAASNIQADSNGAIDIKIYTANGNISPITKSISYDCQGSDTEETQNVFTYTSSKTDNRPKRSRNVSFDSTVDFITDSQRRLLSTV